MDYNWQIITDALECYKRNLGRQYGRGPLASVHTLYNATEDEIAKVVQAHGTFRSSKPYKLPPLVPTVQMLEDFLLHAPHNEQVLNAAVQAFWKEYHKYVNGGPTNGSET